MTLHVTARTLSWMLHHIPAASLGNDAEGLIWGAPVVVETGLAPRAGYLEVEDGRRLELVIDEAGMHPVRERVG